MFITGLINDVVRLVLLSFYSRVQQAVQRRPVHQAEHVSVRRGLRQVGVSAGRPQRPVQQGRREVAAATGVRAGSDRKTVDDGRRRGNRKRRRWLLDQWRRRRRRKQSRWQRRKRWRQWRRRREQQARHDHREFGGRGRQKHVQVPVSERRHLSGVGLFVPTGLQRRQLRGS